MKLYGVFVAIDEYSDGAIGNLRFAASDAIALESLVRSAIPEGQVSTQLLLDREATKRNVVKVLGDELARAVNSNDIVMVSFSGHGSPETNDGVDAARRYLVLHDTEYANVFATGLDMERELPVVCLERLRARLIVAFVDACFSGRAGGRTFEGPKLGRRRLRGGDRAPVHLRRLRLGEGRVIVAASDDTEVAQEDANLGHGVFSHFLVRALLCASSARYGMWGHDATTQGGEPLHLIYPSSSATRASVTWAAWRGRRSTGRC